MPSSFVPVASSFPIVRTCFAAIIGLLAANAHADKFEKVNIQTLPVAESVYMLTGAGGNIGVSAGADGILIIDDQFAPLAEKISAALAAIANNKVRYVINTHYHGDHSGGNAAMKHTHNATVFAHDNVRIRLQSKPEISTASLPVVTYADGIKFHFNGDTIHVAHLHEAHTDGDSYVYFEQANVIHTGDVMFNGMFPYIDLNAGGTVNGYIHGVEQLLSQMDDKTQIIPGHGKLATKEDVKAFLAMLTTTNAIVQRHKREGKSLEAIKLAGLGKPWNDWAWAFITEAKWIDTLYNSQ